MSRAEAAADAASLIQPREISPIPRAQKEDLGYQIQEDLEPLSTKFEESVKEVTVDAGVDLVGNTAILASTVTDNKMINDAAVGLSEYMQERDLEDMGPTLTNPNIPNYNNMNIAAETLKYLTPTIGAKMLSSTMKAGANALKIEKALPDAAPLKLVAPNKNINIGKVTDDVTISTDLGAKATKEAQKIADRKSVV